LGGRLVARVWALGVGDFLLVDDGGRGFRDDLVDRKGREGKGMDFYLKVRVRRWIEGQVGLL
jgi:hypothetical protein